ncbi:MAG: GntR family transcriptional regulator [Chloroflexi bacterium]|nr:GntR family transcriptional regulator [Chloroflexota bacterium]
MELESVDGQTSVGFGNLHGAIVDRIRGMVLEGTLKPGEWLRIDDLATKFGVSTIPVREALRQLQAEGLVTFHPRRGAMVTPISVAHYEEIYLIREQLEKLACRFAAQDFDQIPLVHLKQILDEIEIAETAQDVPRRLKLVREFFFTIFNASQKEYLLRILSTLWDLSEQYRRHFSSVPKAITQRILHYRMVYQACETRDAEGLVRVFDEIHAFGKSYLIPLLREEEKKTLG